MAAAPARSVLAWAAAAIGPGATLRSAVTLRAEAGPWLLHIEAGGPVTRAVLKTGPNSQFEELAPEAAALELAESYGLPTPRLIAVDLKGEEAGAPALLTTMLEGSSRVPLVAGETRLRALGAAAAAVHRISVEPTERLPRRDRHMPWIDFAAMRREGQAEAGEASRSSSELLQTADDVLRSLPPPADPSAFVHGDLWHGNTLWIGDTCMGIIDWEAAGAGSYGIDLGSLRWDAALLYPPGAADEVLAGWEAEAGRRAENVAYWDVVAALNTPADMTAYEPSMQQAGRPDLDGATLTARRDEFLTAALDRLER